MIKNIVFDFGGILTGLDKDRCVAALHKIGAGRIAYYVDECKQEDLFHVLEMGDCTVHEFCEEARRQCSFTDECGVHHKADFSDEDLVWAWSELLTGVPEEKLRAVKRLHDSGEYQVMVLSNTNVIHWEKARNEFFAGDTYFHRIFLSCEMHLVKPDAEIYRRMLAEAGIKAEETLFIDDSLANCEGAKAVGINVLHDPTGTLWLKELA